MRTRPPAFVVPPYSDDVFPYRAFPPWKALMRVFDLVAAAMRRRAMPTCFKHLEVALLQASQRIVAVALGDLPLARWYRRARAALLKLERAKLAVVDCVAAKTLDLTEAQDLVDGIDATIALLVDEVARVPMPDELRVYLPDLQSSMRLVH